MKIIILCFAMSFTFLGCGKKTVDDPGPRFSLTSAKGQFQLTVPTEIQLKRADSQSGPLILMQPTDPNTQGIKATEKRFICANQKVIEGKKILTRIYLIRRG